MCWSFFALHTQRTLRIRVNSCDVPFVSLAPSLYQSWDALTGHLFMAHARGLANISLIVLGKLVLQGGLTEVPSWTSGSAKERGLEARLLLRQMDDL